ncbi:hypothetical protein B0H21DRAFT_714693 [Amylocystis lapponica]|nr:hypothetical protein B0H21DRAFT_714693 [Amylocystis lapponica]
MLRTARVLYRFCRLCGTRFVMCARRVWHVAAVCDRNALKARRVEVSPSFLVNPLRHPHTLMPLLEIQRNNCVTIDLKPYWSSRESAGVWVVNGQVYKVYTRVNGFNNAVHSLSHAEEYALPTAEWKSFPNARVSGLDDGGWKRVYVIRSRFIQGRPFTLQHGIGTFRQALRSLTTERDVNLCERGCLAAISVGLQDPQGFIRPGTANPILFIDVHTSSSSSAVCEDMLSEVGCYRVELEEKRDELDDEGDYW